MTTPRHVTVFDHDGTRHPAIVVGRQNADVIVALLDQGGAQWVWDIACVQFEGELPAGFTGPGKPRPGKTGEAA
jgi:hypothetical protein